MTGDLHIHTTYSDGALSPSAVIEMAARIGLTHISLTDHDYFTYTQSLADEAKKLGVVLINGIEVSAYDFKRNRRVHILCYYPKLLDELKSVCDTTVMRRNNAGILMTEMVQNRFPITLADVQKIAGNCIFKQHISQTLVNFGYSTSVFSPLYNELFNLKTGTCLVELEQPDVIDVIKMVQRANGICVMAHPFTYDSIDLLDELVACNLLDGIEVWTSKADGKQVEYLEKIARRNGLIMTGGSDFHGAYSSRTSPLGCAFTPEESLKSLLSLSDYR